MAQGNTRAKHFGWQWLGSIFFASVLLASLALAVYTVLHAVTPHSPTKTAKDQSLHVLTTASGSNVEAVLFGGADSTLPPMVYFHGIAGRDEVPLREASQQYRILSPSYPAGVIGLTTQDDSQVYQVVDAAMDMMKNEGYHESEVIVFGYSLGSAPAMYAAATYPELKHVYIYAGFASFYETCLSLTTRQCELLEPNFLNNLEFAAQAKAPIHIVHGTKDTVVPLEQGRKLYEAVRGPKSFRAVQSGHLSFSITEIIDGATLQ